MKTSKLLTLIILLFCAVGISAQYTPDSGSTERKAIVDGLRGVKSVLKRPVIFQVDSLQVKDGWATSSKAVYQLC